jgi:hypothetical protein
MLVVRVGVTGMVQLSQGIPDYECLSKINGVPSVRHGLDVRLWFPWVTDGRLKRGMLIPVLAA